MNAPLGPLRDAPNFKGAVPGLGRAVQINSKNDGIEE